MTSLVTTKFRIENAARFLADINANVNTLYTYISRPYPWTPSDSNIPTPALTTQGNDYEVWRGMFAAKRIQPSSDACFVVPMVWWSSGTVYTQYTDTTQLFGTATIPFYVVNSTNDVYKCLFNNHGVASTVSPTGQYLYTQTTSDGYVWKYLYTVDSSSNTKFLTSSYLPVPASAYYANNSVVQAAVPGAIDIVDIQSGGSGYIYTLSGNVISAATTSTVTLPNTATSTANAYAGSMLFIVSGPGAGAFSTISSYNFSTKTVTLSSPLSSLPTSNSIFVIYPSVSLKGDGTGFVGMANTYANGTVQSVKVLARGNLYTTVSNVVFTASAGTGASAFAYVPPQGGHGANVVQELGATTIMINTTMTHDESGKVAVGGVQFRTYGLLKNPILAANTTQIAQGGPYCCATMLNMTSTYSTFSQGELVTGNTSGTTAMVLDWNYGGNSVLRVTNSSGSFNVNEKITGANSGAYGTLSSITASELVHDTGTVIYIENVAPVTRSNTQSEAIRLILDF
jgi:hypothetical protein